MDVGPLVAPGPPWIRVLAAPESEVRAALSLEVLGCNYILSGEKMRSKQGALVELKRLLAFPEHFGMNWDALDDCLRDMSWAPATAYVLLVTNAQQLLADEPTNLSIMLDILIAAGQDWERSGIAFHVLLQTESDPSMLQEAVSSAQATRESNRAATGEMDSNWRKTYPRLTRDKE